MFSFIVGGASKSSQDLWHDRDIKFDLSAALIRPRKGEYIIDSLSNVEDTKGSTGDRGLLTLTNLRVIWQSHRSSNVSMSIGLNTVTNVTIQTADSRLKGSNQSLFLMTRQPDGTGRLEFIFSTLAKAETKIFDTVQEVVRQYETSRLYREVKLRTSIVKDKVIELLPRERIISRSEGVWNLSSDQGNLGVLHLTNLRLVWFAAFAENFNVSVPYIRIETVEEADSKFGRVLVVEVVQSAGGFLLGFRVDPAEKLAAVLKEITALRAAAMASPDFGITVEGVEAAEKAAADAAGGAGGKSAAKITEDVTIDASESAANDAFAAYFADSNKEADRPVVFSPELGLAVESPPEGLTMERLWSL